MGLLLKVLWKNETNISILDELGLPQLSPSVSIHLYHITVNKVELEGLGSFVCDRHCVGIGTNRCFLERVQTSMYYI